MCDAQYEPAKVPEGVKAALLRYAEDHVPLGDFLMAVLRNDLKDAFARADANNCAVLRHIVGWVYWELPGDCWGSAENVQAWLLAGDRGL